MSFATAAQGLESKKARASSVDGMHELLLLLTYESCES
jgi:hypothetical protein